MEYWETCSEVNRLGIGGTRQRLPLKMCKLQWAVNHLNITDDLYVITRSYVIRKGKNSTDVKRKLNDFAIAYNAGQDMSEAMDQAVKSIGAEVIEYQHYQS